MTMFLARCERVLDLDVVESCIDVLRCYIQQTSFVASGVYCNPSSGKILEYFSTLFKLW